MSPALAIKPKSDREIRFVTLTPFREANGVTIDPIGRTARCIIITEGLGNLRDRNYYTADAIESAAEVFEGKQFYINHPSESEEDDRPERDVRDLAGWFSGCALGHLVDPQTKERLRACFANLHFDEAEGGETAMAKVKAALAYQKQFPMSKDVYAGISINGGGLSHPGSIKGMQVNMVTEIQEAFSADIVTKPARGGRFLALVKEAAKAAAWTGSRTQQSRESLPRMGAEGGRYMATATKDKKEKEKVKPAKEVLTEEQKAAKVKEQRKLRFHATNLMLEVKSLKRKAKEADAQDNLDAFKEVASEKLKTAGAKFQKMKANADAAGGELADLLLDIQQDIGELSKLIGMGGGADEVPAEDVPVEGEDDAVPAGDMPVDEMPADEEQEKEGEDEKESEDEKETTASEGEDEQEGEGGEDEQETAEGEDEKEGEEAFGGDDDDEDDEDADYGMGDEEEESGQAMRFKCGKCGETNNVATPKGFKLVAAESAMGESERGMQGFIAKLQRQLEAKEGRFVKTNHRLSKVLKENFKLRAKVTAYDRMDEATRLLKEANIPADILPVKDLVTLYEPEQWGAAIRNAKRMLEREQKLLGKAPRLKEGAGGDGKEDEKDDSLITSFHETYKGK